MALSPMMKQYSDIKEKYKDCILFFRLGDFYEMFFEDAKIASKELELTLTGKNCGLEERAPMCGVPFHSYENYASSLVSKGYKVAICEQVEDAAEAKGLVKRDVVRVITPGTMTISAGLKESENNFLASVLIESGEAGVAYCDITTGQVSVAEFDEKDFLESLINHLVFMSPKEIIINRVGEEILKNEKVDYYMDTFFTTMSEKFFSKDSAHEAIKHQYGISAISGIGLKEEQLQTRALGSLFLYLLESQKQSLTNLQKPYIYEKKGKMALDKATIRNLELTETIYEKQSRGSLLGILDKTHTAMGGRKIKNWIREPLRDKKAIQSRLDAVEALVGAPLHRNNIKESLKSIYDFERLSGRIAFGNAHGRDLTALKTSLTVLPELKMDVEDIKDGLLNSIYENLDILEDVVDLIHRGICEDPPFSVREGGIIAEGYSEELDNLKFEIKDAQDWIVGLEATERERTGIKNLKVGYNKVFGYYLEITKSYYDQIPEEYIRKQTLANAERFITPKLKEVEALVLNAETKINKLEYELFTEIKEKIKREIPRIQKTSEAVAKLDVLTSFAHVAEIREYIKPVINDSDELHIKEGRHPVIEATIKDGLFVPNDLDMNLSNKSLLLITGPNMAGKSTYMRQVALIVLMTQAGSFVPASYAKIGIVDHIFTRIGASDNLAGGQSTFFVEMSELAFILNKATSRSLIILDEIGRGTSTYDGLSIAWALCHYLCRKDTKARTLFASHYHELTELEDKLPGFENLNVHVSEDGDNIVFLHKIVKGKASRSYGIHVARLAGLPESMLSKAESRLQILEQEGKISKEDKRIRSIEGLQMSLFDEKNYD